MADYILFGVIMLVSILMIVIIVANWQTYRAMQEYIKCINHMEECYRNILLTKIIGVDSQNCEQLEDAKIKDEQEC